MAYWKTILKGNFGSLEKWTTSTSWGIFGLAPDAPDQAAADAILAKLLAFTVTANVPTSFKALLSPQAAIEGWRVELRGENERVLSVAEGNMASQVNGSGSATKTPQDAVVFSLRTSTPGARGRGRMYWPALGATIGSTFQLTSPTSTLLAADMRIWLNAIGTQMNAGYASISSVLTVVASVRSVTAHANHNINAIQVGSILDTQRRRRDALLETYVSSPYP